MLSRHHDNVGLKLARTEKRFVLRLEAMNQFAARRKAGLDNTEDTRSRSSEVND